MVIYYITLDTLQSMQIWTLFIAKMLPEKPNLQSVGQYFFLRTIFCLKTNQNVELEWEAMVSGEHKCHYLFEQYAYTQFQYGCQTASFKSVPSLFSLYSRYRRWMCIMFMSRQQQLIGFVRIFCLLESFVPEKCTRKHSRQIWKRKSWLDFYGRMTLRKRQCYSKKKQKYLEQFKY